MLEDEEDVTSYTMSGTAEIQQKSFNVEGREFILKDSQQKSFKEDFAFQVFKTPSPGVCWDFLEQWQYVEEEFGASFIIQVSFGTRKSGGDLSIVPVEDTDKIDGSFNMDFMMPAWGGTATWKFHEE